jgi:hypothetical protein
MTVDDSSKYSVGMFIWIRTLGWFEIIGVNNNTTITVQNNGTDGNASAGTAAAIGSIFCPSVPPSAIPDPAAFFNLYDVLASAFTTPSGTNTASMVVSNGAWYKVGMVVYLAGAGWYIINSYDASTNTLTVQNADPYNVAGGTVVAAGSPVYPSTSPRKNYTNQYTMQNSKEASVATTNANDVKAKTVTFPVAFVSAPTSIVLSLGSDSNLGAVYGAHFYARNITTTGFDLYYSANAVYTANVHWIAML